MGLTISVMGLALTLHAEFLPRGYKRFFIIFFSVIIAYVIADFSSQISLVLLGEGYSVLSKVGVFFESALSSVLMPLLTVSILHVCGQSVKTPFFYFNIALLAIYYILLIATQFTEDIYYITPDNVYHRGPLYPVLLFPPVLLMVSNLIGAIVRKDKLSKKEYHSLLLFLIIPMVAMVLQMLSYGLLLIVLATSVSSMIMFYYIMYDQIDKNIQKSKEISDQQLKIRTLQMRPHFVYNTLSNIYYLCQQDPVKAQEAIDDFTKYLRKNFTAITKEELIPFSEELEHARAYLAVVKVRYEDLLFVEYDTEFSAFRLPPLTLEPIVENSVKHGLDPDAAPLHILISSKRQGNQVLITVEDTGTGFDSEEDLQKKLSGKDDEPHIGLSNVQSRLSEMCGGTLTIAKRPEGGTIVTLAIPL